MQNETIDKLKNAGYITVTDDSQGIADKVGISGGSSNIDINGIRLHKNAWLNNIKYFEYQLTKQGNHIYDVTGINAFLIIDDPYDENYEIILLMYVEAASETRANLFIPIGPAENGIENDYPIEASITINAEAEDPTVEIGEITINPEAPEICFQIFNTYRSSIQTALLNLDPELVEKMIGESQDTALQEPEGS